MKTSCGVLILNEHQELLLGHVTGNKFYDIPKGLLDPGEDALGCALRECKEETSLCLAPDSLVDLGVHPYNKEKKLHLFITRVAKEQIDFASLKCESFFEHHHTRKMTPEVDGFKWVNVKQLSEHCAKSMGHLLQGLEVQGVFQDEKELSSKSRLKP